MDAETACASWRGVPLSEIIGSQSPWGAPEFPLISPAYNHTVLYHIPSNGNIGDRPPKPKIGQDKWDSDHVRMPCSSKSLYPVEDDNGETYLKKRWEMIEEALQRPILNSEQLAETILSYNTKFKTVWKFRALHTLFNDHLEEEVSEYFFTVTLPQIVKLALDLPKLIQAPIPLLKQHKNHSISLTQQQIASILANAFFCTFPRRNTNKRTSEYSSYPHINFSSAAPRGVATFSRRSVPPRLCPTWAESQAHLAPLPTHVDSQGRIEDAHSLIQLDFANKYLGGGVLGHGCVQEEIRFAICPELMTSMLFTEVLRPNEALLMIGCERYSQYSGYGRSFRWTGGWEDSSPLDSAGRKRVAVLAVDALPYSHQHHQYRKDVLTRELNKAWVGFSFYSDEQLPLQHPGIATGNWGCGAFGGSPEIKCLIQLMAAAQARRPMAYYTFGDTELRDEIINVYNLLARYNVTVGELYNYIIKFSSTDVRRSHLHSYLQQVLIDEEKEKNKNHSQYLPPADKMDTTTSPKTKIQNEQIQQKEILNDSPDLFSQDEESKKEPDSQTNKHSDSYEISDKTLCGTKIPDNVQRKEMIESNNQTVQNTAFRTQTKRLFDEMTKLDENVGQGTSVNKDNITSRYFDGPKSLEDILQSSGSEIESNDISMATSSQENTPKIKKVDGESKMADGDNKMAAMTNFFDAMQKMENEHGRSNCTVSSTPPLFKHTTHDSDASMESDKLETSSHVKKKIAKKITDYFSKKP